MAHIFRSYTRSEAREYMYATFKARWDDETLGWAGVLDAEGEELEIEPQVFYDNNTPDTDPPSDYPWLRVYIRHFNDGEQLAMADGGRKLFERQGLVIIDIRVPPGTGLNVADQLVNVCKSAFEGRRAAGDGVGIVFSNVRAPEEGEGAKPKKDFAVSVLADFSYQEIVT
jgi:hypothetical protein